MLLNTIDDVKRYVALDMDRLAPTFVLELELTEAEVIRPLLGADLLAWLQAQVDAPGFDPTAATLAAGLLRAVQAPLARLAVAGGTTLHQVTIDATGVHIISTEVSKTAFQWQLDRVQALLLRRGQADLDRLVQWLEAHRDDSPELRAWATSEAGQRHRRELFTSTADFQLYENISASRAVFEALGPVRRRLEAFELGPVLSPAFLAELREQVRTRALTSDNENLLRTYVRPALASLTLGYGVPEVGLRLAGDGVELARTPDSPPEYSVDLQTLLQQKANQALMAGARYLRQLTDYLDRTASATRFATYFTSSAYTAPAAPPVVNLPTSKTYKFC